MSDALLAALNTLEQHTAERMRCVPGACALHLFGSRITQRDDPYADLDLHLVTSNPAAARRIWPAILGTIAAPLICWPLSAAADNTAFTLLLAGESPYHKIDISLGGGSGLPPPLHTAPIRGLWQQSPWSGMPTPPPYHAYQPAWGSYGHLIIEELLSGIRYLKARRRGKLLTAWRFVRSKPDLVLSLLAAQHLGERLPTPLSTWAIRELEPYLDSTEQAAFFAALDWRSPMALDHACLTLNRMIVQYAGTLAAAAGEPLPHHLFEPLLAFVAANLPTSA